MTPTPILELCEEMEKAAKWVNHHIGEEVARHIRALKEIDE